MKKFVGILLTSSFIFSGNLLGASVLENIIARDASSELNVDYLKDLKVDNYIIGPGDTLSVVVSYDYPELSRVVVVDGEGSIYLPKIKRIFVKGLTSTELMDLLDKAYEQFINFPDVEISMVNYRPIRVLVEGEIVTPGLLTMKGATNLTDQMKGATNLADQMKGATNLTDQMKGATNLTDRINPLTKINYSFERNPSFYFPTVFDAIQGSGGITTNSDIANIQVIRQSTLSEGGGQKKATINFERLLTDGDNSQNIRIYDGDIIKVRKAKEPNKRKLIQAVKSNLNPKFIKVYVTGRVLEPGSKTIPKTTTLNDAIDISGGTKIIKGKIKFIRFNNDGSFDKRKITYSPRAKRDSYNNPVLSNGDLIFVGNSILSNTTEVISEITAPLTGLYSTYGLLKIIND